jgi:hypothetical protein
MTKSWLFKNRADKVEFIMKYFSYLIVHGKMKLLQRLRYFFLTWSSAARGHIDCLHEGKGT